jgi:predicted enzyme related to lactoylglutathione lyase
MTSKFTELCIDSNDPQRIAPFWAAVLGYAITSSTEDEVELTGPPGSGPTLLFLKVPESKTTKNRLHIDVKATAGANQAQELERLLALGARTVDIGQGPDVSWVVLADPDGNEFCLLSGTVD